MSRTFTHRPFRHAFPEYEAYYSPEREPLDPAERSLYYIAGPDWPRDGDKHWSRSERSGYFWIEDAVNRGRNFTRAMQRQRLRAEIAEQLADEQADHDENRSYLMDFYAGEWG